VVQGQIGGESRPGSLSFPIKIGMLRSRRRKLLRIENPRVGCWIPVAMPGLEE
jgi:hypothetical protein